MDAIRFEEDEFLKNWDVSYIEDMFFYLEKQTNKSRI